MCILFLYINRVSVIGGLESWTGVLDWSTGLEYGVLECTINWH